MPENDFIPRKAIYDAVNDIGGCDATEEWAKGYDSAIDAVMGIIEGLPAADVAPVCHGHWINENFYTRCSACGNMAIYDKYGQEVESDYCPRCGAKMDGAQ